MNMLVLVLIVALTTSIASYIGLIRPVLQELAMHSPDDPMVTNSVVTAAVFIILGALLFPFVALPYFVPSLGEAFKLSLLNTLMGE